MSIRRTALALATLALATLAIAAPPATAEQLRDLAANRLDALVVTCPVPPPPAGFQYACYRIGSSADHHRWEIDRLVAGFTDLRWVTPWQAYESGAAGRLLVLAGQDGRPDWTYAFSLFGGPGRFETTVLVHELGPWE